jgi:hypothetical protein
MTGTEDVIGGVGHSAADANVREVVWTMLGARRQKPAELALRLGISKSAIYSRLSGKTVFTVSEVAMMSEHFDIPPSVFFAGNSALLVGRGVATAGSTISRKLNGHSGVSRSDTPSTPRLRAVA